MLEISVLGPLEARIDGEELPLGGAKQQAVLAYLVVHTGTRCSADRCVDAVWGEEPPAGATHSLQTYVSNLRRILDPSRAADGSSIIDGTTDGYAIRPDAVHLDVDRFREFVADADTFAAANDLTAAAMRYEEALGLWRGRFLGDLGDAVWATTLSVELTSLRQHAELGAINTGLESGSAADLVGRIEAFIEREPYQEQAWGLYMLALYRGQRQVEALQAFQDIAAKLGDELGLEPGPELVELENRMLIRDPSLLLSPSLRTNLPAAISGFVGRSAELAELSRLLGANRLVTITGAGGSGKTTIALEVGRQCLDSYRDGVWVVELASVPDGDLIASEALGSLELDMPASALPIDSLTRQLSSRHALIILDNCEHLLVDAAAVARHILEACPEIEVLATSRERLGVVGEMAWQLPQMELPAPNVEDPAALLEVDAIALFVTRATAARSVFELTRDNAAAVAAICRRLDGLPMAIELSAARTRSMTAAELLQRLTDRFSLLVGGDRSTLRHHQTLLGTVEWSYDLLEEAEQKLYRNLSVFRGGFTLEAAQAVAGSTGVAQPAIPDLVDRLVEKSLVITEHGRDTTRYDMLETMRQHGTNLLVEHSEDEAACRAHLDWCVRFVRENKGVNPIDQQKWLSAVRAEHDNIRAAIAWALERDPATGTLLTSPMATFWMMYNTDEEAPPGSPTTSYLAEGARWSRDMLDAAGPHLPAKQRARAQSALGGLLLVRLDAIDESLTRTGDAIGLFHDLGDVRGEAWATFYNGMTGLNIRPHHESLILLQRALELHGKAGDLMGMSMSMLLVALATLLAEGPDAAQPILANFDQMAQSAGIPYAAAHADEAVSFGSLFRNDDTEDHRTRLTSAIQQFASLGNRGCVAHSIEAAAAFHAREGRLVESAVVLGSAHGIRERLAMVSPPYEQRTRYVEGFGLGNLNADARAEAFEQGRVMRYHEALEYVLGTLNAR